MWEREHGRAKSDLDMVPGTGREVDLATDQAAPVTQQAASATVLAVVPATAWVAVAAAALAVVQARAVGKSRALARTRARKTDGRMLRRGSAQRGRHAQAMVRWQLRPD